MTYNNDFRCRVFAAYWGCAVMIDRPDSNTHGESGEMCKMYGEGLALKIGAGAWSVPFEYCKPILKPLSEISEEHQIEVAEFATGWYGAAPLYFADVPEWLREIMDSNGGTTDDYVSGRLFQSLLDKLREWGYDVGFGEVTSLIEAGLAVKS